MSTNNDREPITTEDVRACYVWVDNYPYEGSESPERGYDFDRWLAERDRAVVEATLKAVNDVRTAATQRPRMRWFDSPSASNTRYRACGAETVSAPYSIADRQWLDKKRASQLMLARSDWRRSLDDIAWEHVTFHNDIPFSGDARPARLKAEDMATKTIEHVVGPKGEDLGSIHRYTETERKTGRWVNRGTVERVCWRAMPSNAKVPITYHSRRKDAVAAVRQSQASDPVVD